MNQPIRKKNQLPTQLKPKLFKHYLERNNKWQNEKSTFFNRLTHHKFNTFNNVYLFKFLKLKGPIFVGLVSVFIFEYNFKWYQKLPESH